MAELLEGVHERTCTFETCGRIDDLVAMNLAAAALELVLWPEGKRSADERSGALRVWWHDGILLSGAFARKT